jgi:cold shock CspA family protein
MQDMKYGIVVAFVKGQYGFLWNDELGRRVFFHVKNYNGMMPCVGDEVSFELKASVFYGKPDEATNVTPVALGTPVTVGTVRGAK